MIVHADNILRCTTHKNVSHARDVLDASISDRSYINDVILQIAPETGSPRLVVNELLNHFDWWTGGQSISKILQCGNACEGTTIVLTSKSPQITAGWLLVMNTLASGANPHRTLLFKDTNIAVVMEHSISTDIECLVSRYRHCRYRVAYNVMTGQFAAKLPDLYCAINGLTFTRWVWDSSRQTVKFHD